MKKWAMLIFITFSLIFQCNGIQENESSNTISLRERVVDGVLKKIKKISSEAVSNISTDEKGEIMRSIESKLKKAAEPLGKKGETYVQLIMRGLRSRDNSTSSHLRSQDSENKLEESLSKDGQKNSKPVGPRDARIHLMMEKINKLSVELNNATNTDEQEKILKSIGEKVKKASKTFGNNANKYYNLIMKNIRDNIKKIKHKEAKSVSLDNVRRYANVQKDYDSTKSRNTMIEEILRKINKISESEDVDDQKDDFSVIEKKLREVAQPLGEKGLKYVNLVIRALRSNNKKLRSDIDDTSDEVNELVKDAVRLHYIVKANKGDKELRNQAVETVAKAIGDIINKNSSRKHHKYVVEKVTNTTFEHMKSNDILKDNREIKLLSDFIVNAINEANKKFVTTMATTAMSVNYFITKHQDINKYSNNSTLCKNTVEVTCSNIKNMNILKCAYVEENVSLHNLCDGIYDCTDRSDEKHCAKQAIERIRFAQRVLADLDKALDSDCLVNDINEKVLSKQNLILRDVLKAQLNFIEKYNSENVVIKSVSASNTTLIPVIREITEVIGTLTIALEKALCSNRDFKSDHSLRRFNEIFEQAVLVTNVPTTTVWPPKACACTGEHCANCTTECKRICWRKSSLSHWNCDSVNDTSMVPLSVLCDGKYDCLDESDERDCFTDNVHGKFESHKIFSEITESLKLKASKEFKGVRSVMWTLINVIADLEKLSLNSNPNPNTLKENRDESFGLLGEIYAEILKHLTYAYEAEEVYAFFLSINQQLGAILKRIGTGNKKIITDDCFCINGKCAATYCTRRCQRACLIKPKLTKYYCDNSNKSVGLENICNGKPDCPQEDDEKECSKDVCRTHHITVLQRKVQEFGVKQKGTAMGEVISTWKTKVLANLKVAEKGGRPTRKVLIELVKDILKDLVLTYGAVEDYRRRDNNYALEHFITIAKAVIDTLRSCGN